jgi:hypothetical protein
VRLLAAAGGLLLGCAAGVAALAVHRSLPGLVLAAVASVAALVALRGWSRRAEIGFVLGWLLTAAVAVLGRPEGDYVVAGDLLGTGLLGTGLVLLVAAAVGSRRP